MDQMLIMGKRSRGNNMLSIIIPVYKTEINVLERCFNSIIGQSYTNYEVIVINDGSEQSNLDDYLFSIAVKDSRFHIINQKNKGVSAARNRAIEESNGEYITFVDSDDCLVKNALQSMLTYIEEYDADIVIGGIITETLEDGKTKEFTLRANSPIICENKKRFYLQQFILTDTINKNNTEFIGCKFTGPWSKIIKRSCISDCRFDEQILMYEDKLFNIHIIERSKRIVVVPNIWYKYNVYSTSSFNKYRPNGLNEQLCVIKRLYDLKENNPEFSSCVAYKTIICIIKAIKNTIYHSESGIKEKRKCLRTLLSNPIILKLLKDLNIDEFIDMRTSRKVVCTLIKYRCTLLIDLYYRRKKESSN